MQQERSPELTLLVDIETVPNERVRDYIACQSIEPDARFQNHEPPASVTSLKTEDLREARILEWRADQKRKAEQDILQKREALYRSAGLKWWMGKIICIGWIDPLTGNKGAFVGDDEALILRQFGELVVQYRHVGGKQSDDFDLPFLRGRYIANDLPVPIPVRTWSHTHDVNMIFGRSPRDGQRGKLADYAWGMGIVGKTGHGSDVLDMYNAAILGTPGAWDKITSYCLQDVAIVAEMHRRYNKSAECYTAWKGRDQQPQYSEIKASDIPF